jgi:hypothetical protein
VIDDDQRGGPASACLYAYEAIARSFTGQRNVPLRIYSGNPWARAKMRAANERCAR